MTAYILVAWLAMFADNGDIILKRHMKAYDTKDLCIEQLLVFTAINDSQKDSVSGVVCVELKKGAPV